MKLAKFMHQLKGGLKALTALDSPPTIKSTAFKEQWLAAQKPSENELTHCWRIHIEETNEYQALHTSFSIPLELQIARYVCQREQWEIGNAFSLFFLK